MKTSTRFLVLASISVLCGAAGASPGAIALFLTCEPPPFPPPAHADTGARRAFRRIAREGGLDPLSEADAKGTLEAGRGLELERLHLPQRP